MFHSTELPGIHPISVVLFNGQVLSPQAEGSCKKPPHHAPTPLSLSTSASLEKLCIAARTITTGTKISTPA